MMSLSSKSKKTVVNVTYVSLMQRRVMGSFKAKQLIYINAQTGKYHFFMLSERNLKLATVITVFISVIV